MFYRRLVEHLKSQNWFAVLIEFLIVVFGVFIGLQVENLNESRKERVEERQIIQRLISDLEVDQSNIEFGLRILSQKEPSLERVYATLTSPYSELINHEEFLADVLTGTSYGWNQYILQRSTFDELLGSGKFSLIGNTDLRLAISNYYLNDRTIHDRINERETEYPQTTYLLIPRFNEFDLDPDLDMEQVELISRNVFASLPVNQVVGELNLTRFMKRLYSDSSVPEELPYQKSNRELLIRLKNYLESI